MEVRRKAEALCQKNSSLLNATERERLINEVLDEAFGLGPLESQFRDATISDILINGPKTVFVERRGRLERTNIAFHDGRHLLQNVQRISSKVGRRVDETSPMVDARLPDGSRLNAIIAPLIASLTAEGKLQAGVLLALPPLLMVAIYFVNRDYLMDLFRFPVMLVVMVALMGLGTLCVRRSINFDF